MSAQVEMAVTYSESPFRGSEPALTIVYSACCPWWIGGKKFKAMLADALLVCVARDANGHRRIYTVRTLLVHQGKIARTLKYR